MIKEIFKNQVHITSIDHDKIEYTINLAADKDSLEDGAIKTVLQSDTTYLFKPTDKLFFLTGCTVPRFKVKQLCEVTGMARVKAIENSTVIIYGNKTEKDIIELTTSYYNVNKDLFLKFIANNYSETTPEIEELKTILNDPETFHVVQLDNYNVKYVMQGQNPNASWVKVRVDDKQFSYETLWKTEENKIDSFDKMLESGMTIVHQNDLLNIININNLMDQEMYEQTDKMFNSEDVNNHVLALEIMANCDYEKSALYLWLLIKDHRNKIYDRPESRHVNYQALCNFFNIRRDHRVYDIEDIVKDLSKRNLINSSHKELLYNLSKEERSDSLNTRYYTVTNIIESEELERVFKCGDLYAIGQTIPEELKEKKKEDEDEDEEDEESNNELEYEDDDEQL